MIKTAGFAGATLLRAWVRTLNYRYHPLGPNVDPSGPALAERYIYAMWHEYLLLPVFCYPRRDVHVLISKHADGQWVAEFCRSLRIPVIRGSTTRGGAEAIRRLLRAGRESHIALTPDGPRGPRRRVQPGLVYLASRLGLSIVPVGFGVQGCWRMKSWDRFAMPHPWTRTRCVTGSPIAVPPVSDLWKLEEYRLRVESSLMNTTLQAEQWATTGVWPPDNGLDSSKPAA
jgi:lysophospholipid acyltransferase (LPLAT)-like uncharacterized protein